MLKDILRLSKQLISIPSTKENPKALQRVLDLALQPVKEFKIEHFEKNGVPSALVYNTKTRPKRFKVILNAHLDVVPAKMEQYMPFERNGKLYGRGASDMKSAAAVETLVFKELAEKLDYSIGLQLVNDEEVGGFAGTKYQIDEGVRADFSIAGEGSHLSIKNEAKGVIWAKIKILGKAAHAAYPWDGDNAIGEMNKFLDILMKKYPVPQKPKWVTTVNLSSVETTNKTFNRVANDCTVLIDVRYIPEETTKIINNLKKLLPPGFKINVVVKEPAQFTAKDNKYVEILRAVGKKITGKETPFIIRHGASDIRHFNRVGCDGVEFGPIGYGLHSDNEWVEITSLENYYLILKEFLLNI